MIEQRPQAGVIAAAERLAQEASARGPAAHDWLHIDRVRAMALRIARDEQADQFVVELAALLHELGDAKAPRPVVSAREWLSSMQLSRPVINSVSEIIASVSYRGAGVSDQELSLEGRCVRDADRLDAMGAIGIARAFTYGGATGRPIHDPAVEPIADATAEQYRACSTSTVNHFAEKLLLLQGRMDTKLGKALAAHRHQVMVRFLEEFLKEWKADA